MNKEAECIIAVTPQEQRLIQILRSVQYGELTVLIQQGQPCKVQEVKSSIMLK